MTGNGATIRRCRSWIESYLEYTKGAPTPDSFRLWSAIATVGAALERRVWVETSDVRNYPNLFVLLVGKPGMGKSRAINPATRLMKKANAFHIAPKDSNRATFLRWLSSEEARDRITEGDAILEEYHSCAIHLSEFGVFVRAHELDLLSALCELYDCPDDYDNRRIYQGKDTVFIPSPQVSILAGTQPGYMASIFPPEAWSQGFMSRVIMIHSGETGVRSLFGKTKPDAKLESTLISDLLVLKHLQGEFKILPEAEAAMEAWYSGGRCDAGGTMPVPTYPRLENYNTRRIEHVMKLSMIASASRSNALAITVDDFDTALEWILEAEKTMPDVFLEMAGRSDSDTLREMWHYAWGIWAGKKQAVHESRLTSFLAVRVPAYQAQKILEVAVAAGYFTKVKDMYTPKPKNDWSVM